MRKPGIGVVCLVMMAGLGWGSAQTQGPAVVSGTAPAASTTAKKKAKPSAANPVQQIQVESAPPTPPSASATAQEAQQRAADQQLLKQQQEQSDKAAQVNNAIVEKAQKQQDSIQKEQRIQDAPGPAQTGAGVTPQVGLPAVPPAGQSQDIQNVPGQALPASTSISPSDLPPATPPPPVISTPH